MTSRFRVILYEINENGIEEPIVYILRAKKVKSLSDHDQALRRVHNWADYQMRFVNRNVTSYSVECLDV